MPRLTEINGLEIDVPTEKRPGLLLLIDQVLKNVENLAASEDITLHGREMSIALSGAFQCANALFGAASAKCNLETPPEDIAVTQDNAGALILRCYHNPAHEWDWNGRPLP